MKFLKSVAMVPAKLFGYPVLSVVAAFHGLFYGLGSLMMGIIKNFGQVILLLFAPLSVAIRAKSNSGLEVVGMVMTIVSAFALLFCNVPNISNFFGQPVSDSLGMWLLNHNNIILTLTSMYLLSCLYEGGRVYANWWTGATPSQPEIPEANPPVGGVAPQSHLTMFSKIQDKDNVSESEGWQLLKEAVAVGENGKMKLGEMPHLAKMVADRAPTSAVVH